MKRLQLILAATAGALAVGCGGPKPATDTGRVAGEVIVSAASSLTDAFTELARSFEAMYPGARVTLNFASSSALATQINEGAPADIFASADRTQVEAVSGEQRAAEPVAFARNALVIAKPKGSTAVRTYADLAKPGLKLVLAAEGVPIGAYSQQSLAAADAAGAFGPGFQSRVIANVRSREANVRALLTKVQLGEADAAIVYRTDIVTVSEVEGVPVPPAYNVVAEYLISPLKAGKNAAGAAAFTALVLSEEGRALLVRHGFTMPAQ